MQPSNSSAVFGDGECIFNVNYLKGMDTAQARFEFFSGFDSANLGCIEPITPSVTTIENSGGKTVILEKPDVEFNLRTKPDCCGTQFQNSNRTWFHFGVRAGAPGLLVKLNLVDLNRQVKMYSQGMAPVYKILPGKPNWERIRDKPTYTNEEDKVFTLSFKYRTPENLDCVVYFAFTYPYSYLDLNNMLSNVDHSFLNTEAKCKDDIYYARETVCLSLDGRRVELLTISSHHHISTERETRLKDLFPDLNVPRAFRFIGKKVIFVSARVHPGETPSSFVFNGLLNLLLNRDDIVAVVLRRIYVFKLIPMLNPDGVARGHYRTDTRGVNLNRMYLNPSISLHPSIYAARALIRYYHYGFEKEDEPYETFEDLSNDGEEDDVSSVDDQAGPSRDVKLTKKVSHMTLDEDRKNSSDTCCGKWCQNYGAASKKSSNIEVIGDSDQNRCERGDYVTESNLFMYLDMHGHASKKGIFMYGNHFEDTNKNIECMLLPKIMSLNNHNFHFTACNFTERNMYLRDRRDGMSREGSGRVAVLKLTGLIYSYTLECNYNTGRIVNALPSTVKESSSKFMHTIAVPPKYTPRVFEQTGRALGASILDLTGNNPLTRLPNSQFHTLNGLRDWIRAQCSHNVGETKYITSSRYKLRNSTSLQAQGKTVRAVVLKTHSSSAKLSRRSSKTMRSTSVPIERKENICGRNSIISSKPSCSTYKFLSSAQTNKHKTSTVNNKVKTEGSSVKLTDKSKSKKGSSKLQIIKEKRSNNSHSSSSSRIQLKEICFVKGTEGKRVIAKYKTKETMIQGCEDNLVVSWDSGNNAHIFSHKMKGPGIQTLKPIVQDTREKSGSFRVHNFARPASVKTKKSKRPLNRLASTIEVPAKFDQLKKRKVLKGNKT